jgi:hypothetical protein
MTAGDRPTRHVAERWLLVGAVALPVGLVLVLMLHMHRHQTLHPVATVTGPPGDTRAYELLRAPNGDFVFRPTDRSWSAMAVDIYGPAAITGVRWHSSRSVTLELDGDIVAAVDGERGTIRHLPKR